MTRSYSSTVELVVDQIALRGSLGLQLSFLLDSIQSKLLLYILKSVLASRRFRFVINEQEFNADEITEDILGSIICFAPYCEIYRALGLDGPEVWLPASLGILELTGRAGVAGCLLTDAALALNMQPKAVHDYVDKLVRGGLIVKRLVCPMFGNMRNRVSVLHLKRFAKEYDPNHYNMQYIDNSAVEEIVEMIFNILETHNIASIPMRAVARHLGMRNKEMYNIRTHVMGCGKKLEYKIKFVPDVEYSWLITRSEDIAAKNSSVFLPLRNLPLYESVGLVLRETDVGMDSQMLGGSVGVHYKHATRLHADFASIFKYPLMKAQTNKQVKYVLFDKKKTLEQQQAAVDAAVAAAAAAEGADDGELVPAETSTVASTPAKASITSKPASDFINKRGGGISTQQKAYEKMAVAFLTQCDGIAAETELTKHIRTTAQNTNIDKKTFARLLDRLSAEGTVMVMELSVPRLRKYKEAGAPVSETISVVILMSMCGDGLDEDGDDENMERVVALREKFIARRHAEFYKSEDPDDAVTPTPRKSTPRKRKVSSLDDGELAALEQGLAEAEASEALEARYVHQSTDQYADLVQINRDIPQTPVPRVLPRKVQEYNLVLFEHPKTIKDLRQLVHYYDPPALLVCAMNLHFHLITGLIPEDEKVTLPPVDSLLPLLPLKNIGVTSRSSALGEPFLQDVVLHADYGESVQGLLVDSGTTLGDVISVEESLELDHLQSQLPQYRQAVLLQLLLLASVGVIRNDESACLNDLMDCLRGYSHLPEVQFIIAEVEQRQINSTGFTTRVSEEAEIRIKLLCALVISQFQPSGGDSDSEVVTSVLERLSNYSFEMTEKAGLLQVYKRNVYRYWRSLVVHTLNITGLDDSVQESSGMVYGGELQDKLTNSPKPCPWPSQKAVDDLSFIWNHPSCPLGVPVSYFALGRANKKVPKRPKSSRNSAVTATVEGTVDGLTPLDVEDAQGAVTTAAAGPAEREGPADDPLASADDPWSREQDLALIANVLHKYLFKKAHQNLPSVLHNFTLQGEVLGANMAPGERFVMDPKDSFLRVHLPDLDFSHMQNSLSGRCVVVVKPHTLSACKKRLPLAMPSNQVKYLCAALLCRDREATAQLISDKEVAAVVKVVFGQAQSQSSLVDKNLFACLIQMLFEDNAERQQKCINRVRLYPAESVAQACRELYVWCLMRKAKESENLSGFTRTDLLEQLFSVRLAPFFLSASFTAPTDERPLGSYSSRCDGLLSLDRRGMLLSHETLSLIYAMTNRSTSTSITVGPDPEVAVYNAQHAEQYSDESADGSSNSSGSGSAASAGPSRLISFETKGFFGIELNRLRMTVTAVSASESLATVAPAPAVSRDPEPAEPCCVPWAAEGDTLPHLYQLFASKLLALLADKPGSNVTQIGAALPLLGPAQVKNLLNELLEQKAIYWKMPSLSLKKKGPFGKPTNGLGSVRLYFVSF